MGNRRHRNDLQSQSAIEAARRTGGPHVNRRSTSSRSMASRSPMSCNFAAHSTMLPASLLKFSADWPGAMAALVEKKTEVPCLFLQGAAGDLSPNPPQNGRGPQAFGQAVGQRGAGSDQVNQVAESQSRPGLSIACRGHSHSPRGSTVSSPLVHTALSRAFFPELVAFYKREYREGVRPQMTVAASRWQAGVGRPRGEPFCGHVAVTAKRRRDWITAFSAVTATIISSISRRSRPRPRAATVLRPPSTWLRLARVKK